MKDKFENIKRLIEQYKIETNAIEIRREMWNKETKPLIKKIFNEFIPEFESPCSVVLNDTIINHEILFLLFNEKSSGLCLRRNDEKFIQSGGGLAYHQNVNGKISATIIQPFIEKIKGDPNAQIDLNTYTPQEIDESLILSHIEKLFEEILEWECACSTNHSIGFKN